MHFFSPANVMRLLEIVRGAQTSFDALATAIALGRRLAQDPGHSRRVLWLCRQSDARPAIGRDRTAASRGGAAAGDRRGGLWVRLSDGPLRDDGPGRSRCRLADPPGTGRARADRGRVVRSRPLSARRPGKGIFATMRARARRSPIPRSKESSSKARASSGSIGGPSARRRSSSAWSCR